MLNYLHFEHIWALSPFCQMGVSPIPSLPGMLGGPTAPGLLIAARIAGTLFLSFARDGAALPVRNTSGLQIIQGPNRQYGH